jgi:glycosidase
MISLHKSIAAWVPKILILLLAAVLATGCSKEPANTTPVTPTPPPVTPNPVTPVDTTTVISTGWWNDAVFYEVFVRSFYDANGDGNGDINGLIQKLDYLNDGNPATTNDLGVTALWLMPVMQSPSYHGYDVTDYRTVEADYGTNNDFRALITAAHARGIKVIIDYVMNHTSEEHPWFTQSAVNTTNNYRDWYRWSATNPGGLGPWGQTVWHNRNGAYYYGIFWSGMPDLNYTTPAVKTELFDIARFWLQDMNVDGFRLDAVKYIFENGAQVEDAPATFQFFQDFRTFYKSVKPDAMAVGEAWSATNKVVPYVQNNRLDFCFEFDLATAIINSVNNNSPNTLTAKLSDVIASYPGLQYGTFLTNHDQDRVMSLFGEDQSKARLAAQLLLTLPGVPFLYYGEEIGMIGRKPDENIRTPLQWTGGTGAGFTTGTPWRSPQLDYPGKNIASSQANAVSLWNTYRKMISIRNSEIALRRGTFVALPPSSADAVTFLRKYRSEGVIVAANMAVSTISNLTVSLNAGSFPPGNYTLTDQLTNAQVNIVVNADGGFANQSLGAVGGRTTVVYKMRKN